MRKFNILSVLLIVSLMFGMVSFAENTGTIENNETVTASTGIPTALQLALDERKVSDEPTHVTVGNSTKVEGAFFTNAFGNNTSDIDVRAMIHGYNPIVWETQLTFITDDTVVKELTSEENSNGDTVYTITLEDDLTWNEGTPITAADYVFAYALEASREFEEIGGDADILKHIKGFQKFNTKQSQRNFRKLYDVDVFTGVRLLDTYRYSVTVQKEYLPYFYELSLLSIEPCPISVIAPGCVVLDDGDGVYIRNEDEEETELRFTKELLQETIRDPYHGYLNRPQLTCGPYSLVSYDPDEGTVDFHINEYYKGNYEGVKPVITDVTLVPVLPQEAVQKLQDEEVDIINKSVDGPVIRDLMQLANGTVPNSYPAPEDIDRTKIKARETGMANYARLGYGYVGVSCEQGPQQFVKVRQALACLIDSDQYVRTILMGFGMPVKGYYGLGQWMLQAAMGNLRPQDLTAEQEEIWDSFTLDGLDDYSYNPHRALSLLIEDGWVLDENGDRFDEEVDTIRYKRIDEDTLMPLSFVFGLTESNEAALTVEEMLRTGIEEMNGQLIVEEAPFSAILTDHMRDDDGNRKYDLIFMATNFVSVFDPLVNITASDEYVGSQNTSSIFDRELIDLAWNLHETTPMDVQTFEENWIAYQTRYNEVLPSIPIYSNVYFDFYSDHVRNYNPGSETNWPTALLYAWWDELSEETAANNANSAENAEAMAKGEKIIIVD